MKRQSYISNRGKLYKAIALYQQSLKREKRIGHVQGQAMTLLEIGSLMLLQGDFAKALDSWQESYHIFQCLKSPYIENVREIITWVQQRLDRKING